MTFLRPQRLSAFTLLELMVVLVVSSILFTLAYAALGLVQRQQRAFAARTAALGQVSSWQNVLATDFRRAHRVEAVGNQLRCQLSDGLIIYALEDSSLVRQQGAVIDSLPLPVRSWTYFWQGKPRTQGLIDEASLLLVGAHDEFRLQAIVHYSAQQLLSDSIPLSTTRL